MDFTSDLNNTYETYDSAPVFTPIVQTAEKVVASPTLMPPPKIVPKIQPVPVIRDTKITMKGSINNVITDTSSDDNGFTVRKLRCYVPSKDVLCSVNKNVNIDNCTKKLVTNQISNKIFSKPLEVGHGTNRKPVENSVVEVAGEPKTAHSVKFNKKYFAHKNMKVDDIDLVCLQKPMRSSTPTPSVDESTIMAGNIKMSLDWNDLEQSVQAPQSAAADVVAKNKEIFPLSTGKSDGEEHCTQPSGGVNYCTDWIVKSDGVSTNNSDAPPSLYAPSVALSDSLLNTTSISRTPCQSSQNKGKEMSKATTNFDRYKNTVFM